MIVYGITRRRLEQLAAELDLRIEWKDYGGGRGFALRPTGTRFAVTLEEEEGLEELTVVCRHGHEAFILTCLAFPDASVRTVLAHYLSREHFDEIQPQIHAEYLERYGEDPCTCEEDLARMGYA